jgi:hypothetical protein
MLVAHDLNVSSNIMLHSDFWTASTANENIPSSYYWMKDVVSLPMSATFENATRPRNLHQVMIKPEQYCGMNITMDFSRACAGYCSDCPGLFERAWQLIHNSSVDNRSAMSSKFLRKYGNGDFNNKSAEVSVFWHYRTGDITLTIPLHVIVRLKTTIDSLLPNRYVRHVMYTQSTNAAIDSIEATRSTKYDFGTLHISELFHFNDRLSLKDLFFRLLTADIMVSMGSSLPYAVNLFQANMNFVHFYFPPKEVFVKPNGAAVVVKSEAQCSNHKSFQAYFVKRGIIPVFPYTGKVFSAYKNKMIASLGFINNRTAIPQHVSLESHEPQLRGCWAPPNRTRLKIF